MIIFFDLCHIDMWDVVKNDNVGWNEYQKVKSQLNSKVKNFPMCVITKSKCEKVYNCKIDKEGYSSSYL
ncbi:hypothetical protein CR513_33222, partial [Mucuna pruriens]